MSDIDVTISEFEARRADRAIDRRLDELRADFLVRVDQRVGPFCSVTLIGADDSQQSMTIDPLGLLRAELRRLRARGTV